ncbi:DEAD-domain-containing protein [Trichodelitschia bisporula]|uniref:RNA helicase n=1 Tax=Trichodelitschia bisporula TaxID=703511 RepID=A0A6G1HZG0_9PEZI|nr:DEAD-domain-containing protein [Trichodelitschia bisporula]
MSGRASPALSENEFDITDALFGHEESERPSRPATGANDMDIFGSDDDEGFISAQLASSNRKTGSLKSRTAKKGGAFQSMGLNSHLLKAITRKGFSVPTPIQRKTIPLILDGQDVVGMARTGSGKTAAFVIPMIQHLKAHSARFGARAAIMSPSRELALQTLKVVKELGKGTDLRTVLLVGGDSMEEQFSAMTSNPDIIIATPGRFLHLKVEMKLDLSSIEYMVFDEADRLFEMGFQAQLTEIMHGLPSSRQTLLFSATLPKTLVEFARAGLQDPKLVRLDAESKVSPDLENAFFMVKSAEKEGALLHILQDVIKMPTGPPEAARINREDRNMKKRKRSSTDANTEVPTPNSTIVFAATKHHVEYLASVLRAVGYAVSYVYGSLDQTARKIQVQSFRSGLTSILVVTDVAARGIDIPVLANVINYDFPSQPKIFVHRVGRTARAGRKGWSYSLVRSSDIPYMLDLQLFLSRRLVLGRTGQDAANVSFAKDFVVGALQREKLATSCEWLQKLLDEDDDLEGLRIVAGKGEKLYMRTRNSASSESAKRSKEILALPGISELSLLFGDDVANVETAREDMLAQIQGYRPQETIFEVGKRGAASTETAELMRKVRSKIDSRKSSTVKGFPSGSEAHDSGGVGGLLSNDAGLDAAGSGNSDDEFEVVVSEDPKKNKSSTSDSWQDPEHFITYLPRETNAAEERGYGVHSGSNSTKSEFMVQARGATMDLNADESRGFAEPTRAGAGMRWDKKNKKYVSRANDEDGSRGAKLVRGESGQKIAASFRSERFDTWRRSNKIDKLPKVGDAERSSGQRVSSHFGGGGKQFRHKQEKAPKEADRFRDDYDERKKRVAEAKEKRVGRFKDGPGKKELRSVDDVHKERRLLAQRREKNARPTKKRRI